jgi:hypothetical protein
MVTCPHCGESAPEGAAVCGRCGAALEPQESEPQPQAPELQFYEYPYQAPSAPVAPAVRHPLLITVSDVIAAARDALLPLLIVLVLMFGVVAGIAALISSTDHGGFQDWFTSAVMLTAGALGAPSSLTFATSAASGSQLSNTGGLSFDFSVGFDLTAWTVTFALFALWVWRAKRREAAAPSASPSQVLARSALSAVGVSLVLLILALASKASDLFGLSNAILGGTNGSTSGGGSTDPFGGGATSSSVGISSLGTGTHNSIGVQPGWVFVGPLLIALAACLAGRLAAVARRPVGDPGGEWVRKLIGPWRGAAVIVRTQSRAVAVLAGVTVLIYAEYQVFNGQASGREKAALALIGLLLVPNFAVGGLLTGIGVTLFAGGSLGVLLSGTVGSRSFGIGLFGDSRPWLVWVLIGEAVLGTALPWLLVRTRRRVVQPTAFAPGQAWRAALLGAVGGFVIATLGQASLGGSLGLGGLAGSGTSLGLTYSVLGAILAGALWCGASYLAVALQVTPRVPAALAGVLRPAQHSWPSVAAPAVPGTAPVPPPSSDPTP